MLCFFESMVGTIRNVRQRAHAMRPYKNSYVPGRLRPLPGESESYQKVCE
jgi:hypothetical protein